MKYFLHDTNAFDDDKITELFIKFGYEGLGLFYTILEKIGAQEKPIKTDILKAQLKVGKRLEKCWLFMEEIGIISSSNGQTFNERILSYTNKYLKNREKTREKVSQWRDNHEDAKNVTSYVTDVKPVRNHDKGKVGNSIKERGKESLPDFDEKNDESLVFNVEDELLKNQIAFEAVCMKTGNNAKTAKTSLRKFHLRMVTNDKYPMTRKSAYAGFEGWLMNEKKFNPHDTDVGTNGNENKTNSYLKKL